MVPTKAKDLIPEVADDIGIPVEDLSNMLSFYYKENKRLMSNLEHVFVVLRGLGNMGLKGWTIEKEISQKEFVINISRKEENIQALQDHISLLKKGLEIWKQEKARQKESIKDKQKYYENKKSKDDTQREITSGLE
jgi:hypothetical protein